MGVRLIDLGGCLGSAITRLERDMRMVCRPIGRGVNMSLLLALGLAAPTWAGPADANTIKVRIDRVEAPAVLARPAGDAVTAVRDYGSFMLVEMDAGRAAQIAGPGVELRPDLDQVWTRRGWFDTRGGVRAPIAGQDEAGMHAFGGAPADAALMLVQFPGPIQPADLEALRAAGATPVQYRRSNTLVVWAPTPESRLAVEDLARGPAQFVDRWQLADVIDPALDAALAADTAGTRGAASPAPPIDITLHLVNHPALPDGRLPEDTLREVLAQAAEVIEPPAHAAFDQFRVVTVRIAPERVMALALLPSVFEIEAYAAPTQNSERQAQTIAGNLNPARTGPSAPGYLAWLASRGVPTTPASYPIVTVVDGGLDVGTTVPLDPVFYQRGSTGNPTRVQFIRNTTTDPTANDIRGHGHINASIVGGYDAGLGPTDLANAAPAPGYLRGMGLNPYTRLGHYKIFRNSGVFDQSGTGGTDQNLIEAQWLQGTNISTNSWTAALASAYTARSQNYDVAARDAAPGTPGLQPLFFIFSAGNSGPGAAQIGVPATAKNLLTVGATEESDADGTDGCGHGPAASDNIQETASYSSRGPTQDGRVKPEITAPGTHVTGTASRTPGYTGGGVCDPFWPVGQTIYARSSGTSHSTPAVAGVASLAWEFLGRVHGLNGPSPAFMRAYLVGSTRYLDATGGNLPSNAQGFGMISADLAISTRAPRTLIDQVVTFSATGEQFVANGQVGSPDEPVRIVLAWTDVPGPTLANDLDLLVTVNGVTYRGNSFTGGLSNTNANADHVNNIEAVFLPPGTVGPVSVRVVGANIVSDGVPGNNDPSDQDFALSAYNVAGPAAILVGARGETIIDTAETGNGSGFIDPGERGVALNVPIRNAALGGVGAGAATGVTGTLTSLTPTVTVRTPVAAYADLAAQQVGVNLAPFVLDIAPEHPCGAPIALRLRAASDQDTRDYDLTLPTGRPAGVAPPLTFTFPGPGVSIPDNNTTGVQVPLQVNGVSGAINNVKFRFNGSSCNAQPGSATVGLSHTFVTDLNITLISPLGTSVALVNRRSTGGRNFCQTVFDDDAANSIANITAAQNPFTGSFRPETPLAALVGQDPNGLWRLRVQDLSPQDTGAVRTFSIIITPLAPRQCDPARNPCPVDFNRDNVLNGDDLASFIATFLDESVPPGPSGLSVAPCPNAPAPYNTLGYAADFNRDCYFDQEDLIGFITEYFLQTETPSGCVPG